MFVSMNQYGTQVLSPNFSEQAFVQRLRPAEKFIFQITYSKLLKTFLTQAPTILSGCKTGLILSQAITMSVRPCPVLLKSSGMLQGKKSIIRFTNTTHITKILWITL